MWWGSAYRRKRTGATDGAAGVDGTLPAGDVSAGRRPVVGTSCRIADQFADLLDTFETALKLPESVDFEPILDLGFDPQWLAVVDVTTPVDQTDWYGHLRQVRKSVERVEDVREIGPAPLPGIAELLLDQLLADELGVDSIFPRETFESLAADPEERSLFADLLRTGNASIHLVDDSIRYYVARHGDRTVIDVPATTGGPVVRLATDHRAVLDWVDSTIDDSHRCVPPGRFVSWLSLSWHWRSSHSISRGNA